MSYLYNDLGPDKTAVDAVKYFIRRLQSETTLHTIWFQEASTDNFKIKLDSIQSKLIIALFEENSNE